MHSNKQFPLCHLYDQNKTFAVTEFSMPISNDDIIKFKKLHNLKCCFCIDHEDTGNSKLKINKLKHTLDVLLIPYAMQKRICHDI